MQAEDQEGEQDEEFEVPADEQQDDAYVQQEEAEFRHRRRRNWMKAMESFHSLRRKRFPVLRAERCVT